MDPSSGATPTIDVMRVVSLPAYDSGANGVYDGYVGATISTSTCRTTARSR